MQRYMKSATPYYGVSVPGLREVCRAVFAAHVLGDRAAWEAGVRELWYEAERREERYAALELLSAKHYRRFRTLEALPLYEELIIDGAWWDLVDGVATHQVRELLRGWPDQMRPLLLRWSVDQDIWLRRSSIICQVGLGRACDAELLFACIEPSLRAREFFLRKAIGWALRDYAKAEPERVRQYVAEHPELSGLSRREALKHLGD